MREFTNKIYIEKTGETINKAMAEIEKNDIDTVLAQCGLYNDLEMNEKIEDCKNNTYLVKLSRECNGLLMTTPISIGIVGCQRIFLKDILDPILNSIPVDLKYHPQKNDVIYSIEFLHISTDSELVPEENIPKIIEIAINTILKDKNDAPIFIDLRCISKYVDNFNNIMNDLKFEYIGDDNEGFFVRYPITNGKF